jgi:histidinol-phosphate/aromatic aminotransferase/cobyric acid decarboxylase-like protein/GNAT superfamily N-acetyltransferase
MNADTLVAPSRVATSARFTLARATEAERETISRLRHEVYAAELGQHAPNETGRLRDPLDAYNIVLVASSGGSIAGFISITPPGRGPFSIDKYFDRSALPFTFDRDLYEVRLLTVLRSHRGRHVAVLLMYAALRWVEAHGGKQIVAIGRREVADLYVRVGLRPTGHSARAGAVTYDLMSADVAEIRATALSLADVLERLEEHTDWRLPFSFRQPAACFHGGAFFGAIGEDFRTLERRHAVINADVLDAWFPPAPAVLTALEEHLPWLLRTSPPTGCDGLIETIAHARGVAPRHILPGAGSSDLIFRALREWLTPKAHALILDPTYGEYAHVLERVIGCSVDRLPLEAAQNYAVDLDCLEAALADGYDLIVLVNPNSPTGAHIPRSKLEPLLARAPATTRIWIDETYTDYVGAGESLERFAAESENAIVCKSMSKVYALSGARVAYLCAGAHQLESLRAITPPWVVSLPAQVAAVRALESPAYYAARYRETAILRDQLSQGLQSLGWNVAPGIANFLLCQLPAAGPDAATVVARAREHGVFLRNAASMSPRLGTQGVRIAVKDADANQRMLAVLGTVTS